VHPYLLGGAYRIGGGPIGINCNLFIRAHIRFSNDIVMCNAIHDTTPPCHKRLRMKACSG